MPSRCSEHFVNCKEDRTGEESRVCSSRGASNLVRGSPVGIRATWARWQSADTGGVVESSGSPPVL